MTAPAYLDGLCCPRCRSCLTTRAAGQGPALACTDAACRYAAEGFPVVSGQPVLIDFENSVFDRAGFADRSGSSVISRDAGGRSFRVRIRRLLYGRNQAAIDNGREFIRALRARGGRRVLVIGGGEIGDGIADIMRERDVEVVGTDVYVSPNTQVVADGHRLPFLDESFDGVWVQAVLEHVLEPWIVAAEIHRVLKPGGVVYADTPFMQQVHEGAYDFTRFTVSGHRWLFRGFGELRSGAVGGAGTAFLWSLRYLFRSLAGSDKAATLLSLPFFWLRFLDGLARRAPNEDAAAGVFFLGTKSQKALSPKDIIPFYQARRSPAQTTVGHAAAEVS